MTYKMLRRTKSSSLLPIVRLTNYFYPEAADDEVKVTDLGLCSPTEGVSAGNVIDVLPQRSISYASNRTSGSLTPPPDYEQLYQALQLESSFDGLGEERVRKKYACQGYLIGFNV
jgi:hypothetical protein